MIDALAQCGFDVSSYRKEDFEKQEEADLKARFDETSSVRSESFAIWKRFRDDRTGLTDLTRAPDASKTGPSAITASGVGRKAGRSLPVPVPVKDRSRRFPPGRLVGVQSSFKHLNEHQSVPKSDVPDASVEIRRHSRGEGHGAIGAAH